MALFVDGPGCTIDDLTAQDSGLLDVAETEGINVTAKIQLAYDEIVPEIQLWLDRPRAAGFGNQFPAVFRIEQVVATPTLRRWIAMQSLTLFYRDAYFCRLVDRFQAKWNEYSRLARLAREQFIGAGLAIVSDPVHRAALPVVTGVVASQAGGTYYAAVSYVNPQGQEGEASIASSLSVVDGLAMNIAPSDTNLAWNVYAGTAPDAMSQQNDAPLGPADSWTYVPGAITRGRQPSVGQSPDRTIPLVRTWMRG